MPDAPKPVRRTLPDLDKRQRYDQIRAFLVSERGSFDSHWGELRDFLYPRRTRFQTSGRNKGDRRTQNIINSTPRFAARTLQHGLHAGVTSPARPWMKLSTPDPDLNEFAPVKEWLHTVTQRMLTLFLRSNLYTALPTLYGDMGGFGTGALGVLEDDHDLMRAYNYPVGSYAIGVDSRGIVSTFTRTYAFTVEQVVEQFGGPGGSPLRRGQEIDWTGISEHVKNLWDAHNDKQTVDVCWFVCPNYDADPSRIYAHERLPFHSTYFEIGAQGGEFLRQSGFRHFPVLVPRWEVESAEDTYGTDCPGMTALGDVKALQTMEKRSAKAIDKALDPPLVGSMALRTQKVSLLPGDLTYEDTAREANGLRPVHETRLEGIEHIEMKIRQGEERCNRAFYADLFLMLAMSDRGSPVTAREIEERHEEKLLALGPVLERLNDELLDPLVDRVFSMMLEAGGIPEPPEELQGLDLKVEYTSLMAQAQKLVGVVGHERFLRGVGEMAATYPQVLHKVDPFVGVNDYADMLGVNPKLTRTDEEAQASLDKQQQAAAAQAGAEQLRALAAAGKDLSSTPLTGDTALAALAKGGAAA